MTNKGDLSSLNKVWETKELTNFTKSIEAKAILDRVARIVGPVMLRRRWKVLMLKEFYPQQDGLLGMNVNRGETILVRLRPPGNKNEFYPWEHTIGTMIHELTHMEIGPHNSDFYKLMDEIADEVDRDQISSLGGGFSSSSSSSNSGGTFQGQGQKLGGREVLTGQDRAAKAQAIAQATQARLERIKRTSGSGQRLGGGAEDRPMSREELRQQAVQAAQRRMRDDLACRHGQGQSVATTAVATATQGIPRSSSGTTVTDFSSGFGSSRKVSASDSVWICSLCDTANEIGSLGCSVCSSLRNDACYVVALDVNSPPTETSENNNNNNSNIDNSLCKPCTGSSSSVKPRSSNNNGTTSSVIVDLTDSPLPPQMKQIRNKTAAKPVDTDDAMLIDSPNDDAPVTGQRKRVPVSQTTDTDTGSNNSTTVYPVHHMRSCPQCTYMNHMTSTHCAICNTLVYGTSHVNNPHTADVKVQCLSCTYMNDATSDSCAMCSRQL